MTRKLDFIPNYKTYKDVKKDMDEDFKYRYLSRNRTTIFGRPLYERINVQMVITQACPFKCSFCLERQYPQGADKFQNFEQQLKSLDLILKEHPNARITITGGEPGLYPKHVKAICDKAKDVTFVSVNTTGCNEKLKKIGCHINISHNSEVQLDLSLWENLDNVTLQTIFSNKDMTIENMLNYMDDHPNYKNFSFRYLTDINISEYNISIFDEIKNNKNIELKTFRVGDFFVYLIGNYNGKHFRITLGDMKKQIDRHYDGTYSNIIVLPNGNIQTNWGNLK